MKDYKKILKNEDVVIKSIDNLKNEDFKKDRKKFEIYDIF